MQHPVTAEYEDSMHQIDETLAAIKNVAYPTFWFWPNVDAGSDRISKGIRKFREADESNSIYFLKNLAPEDFLRLLFAARCLVGNSSVGIRECSYLGLPVVNIGNRQAGRDHGPNVVYVGYDRGDIFAALRRQLSNGHYARSNLYGDGHAGERIAKLLAKVPLTIEKRITY